MEAVRSCDEMEKAFLNKFRQWWPFAKEELAHGAWIQFSVVLEVKGGSEYYVRGNLDSSSKVKVSGPEPDRD